MNINLKQPEIIAALKLFVGQQGINLKGKDVAIKFTAGRGDTGLSADITITENNLPDFGDEEVGTVAPAAAKPVLTVVSATKDPEMPPDENIAAAEPEAIPVPEAVEKPLKTASLFN